MKVFLDDERPTPYALRGARWPEDVIDLLRVRRGTHLSLDHDLGDADAAARAGRAERTGYDVLVWLEEQQVFGDRDYPVPEVTIHSANAAGWERMTRAIESIERLRTGARGFR